MLAPGVRHARRVWWGSLLVIPLAGTVLVSAQTKKPPIKPKPPESRAVPKSAKTSSAIPGLPSNVSAAVAGELERKLREPLDERNARRKQAAKEAAMGLQRAKAAQDADQSAAALVIAGARQVEALKLAEATQTFQRVMTEHPDNLWTTEARLFLFDLALEHELSLARAEEWLRPAIEWSRSVPKQERRQKPTIDTLTVAPIGPTDPLPLQSLGPNLVFVSGSALAAGVLAVNIHETAPAASAVPLKVSAIGRKPSGASLEQTLPPAREVRSLVADVRLRAGLLHALRGDTACLSPRSGP